MPLRFDHLGIVVADIDVGRDHFRKTFVVERWTQQFADPVNNVNVQFGVDAAGVCFELVSPLGPDSPVSRALKARGPILNHVAYLTDDLAASAEHLRGQGYMAAGQPKPAIAYNGRFIQFFMSPLGFIVELIEAADHRHDYTLVPIP